MKKIAKTIKIITLLALTVFVCGLTAPAPALAAKAKDKPAPDIGYVNRQQIFAAYPGIEDLMNRIQSMRNEAQKDYDTNAKDLPATDKKAYSDKLALQEAQREDELMKPVSDKVTAAIQAVALEKGLTAVVDAGTVVYGGQDITAAVIDKVKK